MTATLIIHDPAAWTYEDYEALAVWLREQAEYVLSSDHEERAALAAETRLTFPPKEGAR